jgi:hypothetical protein
LSYENEEHSFRIVRGLRCLHVPGSQLLASIKQTNEGNPDGYSERSLHS